jgi:hypothetical protein
VSALKAELTALDRRIANLVQSVEQGGVVEVLVAQLRMRQAERERLLVAIGAASAVPLLVLPRKREIERKVMAQVADGRQLLREVLESPLRFTPEGRACRFEGEVGLGRLVAGLAGAPCVASPSGTAETWQAEFRRKWAA